MISYIWLYITIPSVGLSQTNELVYVFPLLGNNLQKSMHYKHFNPPKSINQLVLHSTVNQWKYLRGSVGSWFDSYMVISCYWVWKLLWGPLQTIKSFYHRTHYHILYMCLVCNGRHCTISWHCLHFLQGMKDPACC